MAKTKSQISDKELATTCNSAPVQKRDLFKISIWSCCQPSTLCFKKHGHAHTCATLLLDSRPTSYAIVDTCHRLGLFHQVEELVLSELEKLKKSGFTSTAVEAALNSIEFDLRENNTGSFPRGLSLMLRSMSTWIYDKDPFQPLQWTDALEHFKVCATLLQPGLLLMHTLIHHCFCPSTLTSCLCSSVLTHS